MGRRGEEASRESGSSACPAFLACRHGQRLAAERAEAEAAAEIPALRRSLLPLKERALRLKRLSRSGAARRGERASGLDPRAESAAFSRWTEGPRARRSLARSSRGSHDRRALDACGSESEEAGTEASSICQECGGRLSRRFAERGTGDEEDSPGECLRGAEREDVSSRTGAAAFPRPREEGAEARRVAERKEGPASFTWCYVQDASTERSSRAERAFPGSPLSRRPRGEASAARRRGESDRASRRNTSGNRRAGCEKGEGPREGREGREEVRTETERLCPCGCGYFLEADDEVRSCGCGDSSSSSAEIYVLSERKEGGLTSSEREADPRLCDCSTLGRKSSAAAMLGVGEGTLPCLAEDEEIAMEGRGAEARGLDDERRSTVALLTLRARRSERGVAAQKCALGERRAEAEVRAWRMEGTEESAAGLMEEARALRRSIRSFRRENALLRLGTESGRSFGDTEDPAAMKGTHSGWQYSLFSSIRPGRARDERWSLCDRSTAALRIPEAARCRGEDGEDGEDGEGGKGAMARLAEGLRGAKRIGRMAGKALIPYVDSTCRDFDPRALYSFFLRGLSLPRCLAVGCSQCALFVPPTPGPIVLRELTSMLQRREAASERSAWQEERAIGGEARDAEPTSASSASVPAPSDFRVVREICQCLLVSWRPPEDISGITGYRIFVDGHVTLIRSAASSGRPLSFFLPFQRNRIESESVENRDDPGIRGRFALPRDDAVRRWPGRSSVGPAHDRVPERRVLRRLRAVGHQEARRRTRSEAPLGPCTLRPSPMIFLFFFFFHGHGGRREGAREFDRTGRLLDVRLTNKE
ncbi:hypothetical protein KM043_003337 [Ampulex compressa]|nr:hypothetical protein KM043_003337 [Ampulex compressa]